jgi:hypothetical protein
MERLHEQHFVADLAGQNILPHVPSGSVVFSSEQLLNYLQFVGNYQLYSADMFNRGLAAGMMRGRGNADPNAPTIFQRERAEAISKLTGGGDETKLALAQRSIIADAIRQGRRVFIVMPQVGDVQRLRGWRAMDSSFTRRDNINLTVDEAHPVITWQITSEGRDQMGMLGRMMGGGRLGAGGAFGGGGRGGGGFGGPAGGRMGGLGGNGRMGTQPPQTETVIWEVLEVKLLPPGVTPPPAAGAGQGSAGNARGQRF